MAGIDPELVTGAGNKILDVGVVGAVCIMLLAALVGREWWWQKREAARDEKHDAELTAEREAHERTRELRIDILRSATETNALMRETMNSQAAAFRALMDIVGRRRDEDR